MTTSDLWVRDSQGQAQFMSNKDDPGAPWVRMSHIEVWGRFDPRFDTAPVRVVAQGGQSWDATASRLLLEQAGIPVRKAWCLPDDE